MKQFLCCLVLFLVVSPLFAQDCANGNCAVPQKSAYSYYKSVAQTVAKCGPQKDRPVLRIVTAPVRIVVAPIRAIFRRR